MGAAFALIDAMGAEAPFAFVAGVAFPEAVVAERGTVCAEIAGLEALDGVVRCD